MTSFWTDPRIERLKQFVRDGETAPQIAQWFRQESGHDVTRNAVIGKIARLGLTLSGRASPGHGKPRRSRSKYATNISVPALTHRKTPAFRSGRLPPDPSIPEESNPMTILDLKYNSCRWPLWSGSPTINSLYCGNKKMEGCSYCGRHSRMAWAPARPREKKAEAA